MATNYLLHYRHTRASSNDHKDKISKLETPSTTRLQPRPSGSISPIYRDNLFTIDPPSCTRIPPSLNTSTGGKERFLAGRRVDRVSNIQTSWQVLPDLIPEPEVVAVQVRERRSSRIGGKSHRRQAVERREASVSSIYRFWITW